MTDPIPDVVPAGRMCSAPQPELPLPDDTDGWHDEHLHARLRTD
ncbi:hypothetical protein [Streptomyces manipurensis]